MAQFGLYKRVPKSLPFSTCVSSCIFQFLIRLAADWLTTDYKVSDPALQRVDKIHNAILISERYLVVVSESARGEDRLRILPHSRHKSAAELKRQRYRWLATMSTLS